MTTNLDVGTIDVIKCRNIDDLQSQILSIYERIEKDGFAIVESWDTSGDSFKEIVQLFGHIQDHPNANDSGIVKVVPDHAREGNTYERYVSKTTSEILPHTDGAYLDGFGVVDGKVVRITPPNFVIFQCIRPAEEGGVSYVVDTQEIFERLWAEAPEHAKVITQPRTVSFCAGQHFSSHCPIFEQVSDDRWHLRFRSDVMYVEPWAYASVKYVVENYFFNPKYRKYHLLTEGQMLISDNYRILHSRDAIISDNINRTRLLNKAWIWNASADSLVPFSDLPPDPNTFKAYNMHLPLKETNKSLRPIQTGVKVSFS
jgi:hypothetical protein